MPIYISTFISGLEEPVEQALKETISDLKILKVLDGLIVYSTEKDAGIIRKLNFINNTFLRIMEFKKLGRNPMEQMMTVFLNQGNRYKSSVRNSIGNLFSAKNKTFRIICSDENQLVSVDKMLLGKVESQISSIKGMRVHRGNPDMEFWFLNRSENIGFFMLRITKHRAHEKVLHKGELRPELANILCRMSKPSGADIFLDPFSGYGAIPLERAFSFDYNMIFAIDNDKQKVDCIKQKIKEVRNNKIKKVFFVKNMDSLHMDTIEDEFIDKIVTDPPWGLFEDVGMEIEEFYSLMIKELYRVLKPGGIMVVLTAKKVEFERCLSKYENTFISDKKYDILVSGKKAGVYRIIKGK